MIDRQTAARPTAEVIELPTAAKEPPPNPMSRTGRFPSRVVAIWRAREKRARRRHREEKQRQEALDEDRRDMVAVLHCMLYDAQQGNFTDIVLGVQRSDQEHPDIYAVGDHKKIVHGINAVFQRRI